MNAQDNLTPAWRAYADQVIHRLLTHRHDRALAANPFAAGSGNDADPADPGHAARSAAASAEPPGTAPAAAPGIAAPAQNPRPPEALPPRDLSLAIRLAATLGGEAAMQAAGAPGAITVIHGLTPEELEPASRIITGALLPPGIEVQSDPRRVTRGADKTLILLAPEIRSGSDDRSARRQFPMTIEEALNHGLPLLLLLPDTGLLPEALYEAASLLRLAPLSRAVLLAHLAHSHDLGRSDEAALLAALPPDRLLAGLTSTAFLLALRAPEAQDVAARLTRLTAPVSTDGPRLETMRGSSLALSTARRLVVDLQNWQAGRVTWNELSRSLLLYGPPGTGKTHLVRAMGHSAGIALVTGSFAEWQAAGHLGDLLREMRKTFAEARRQAPAILFIDEIDAVGSREDGEQHGSHYRRQVINGFLAEMDAIAREEGVIVVGACNDPSRIDPAILRPGRFDLKVAVPLPDASMIQGMLTHHLANLLKKDELEQLATSLAGQTAAAIDAAIRAARAEARHTGETLSPGLIRQQLGLTDSPAGETLTRRIALHECGHALVAAALDRGQPIRVLITPEGGETHRAEAPDEGCLADHQAELTVLLAGRAAERLVLGEVSAGAGGAPASDLARATRLALLIETQSGLGITGPVWSDAPAAIALRDPAIHQRVRQRLEAAEQSATAILSAHRDLLQRMAGHLQQHRELAGDALRQWLARVSRAQMGPAGGVQVAEASASDPQDRLPGEAPNGPPGDRLPASPGGSQHASGDDIPHGQ